MTPLLDRVRSHAEPERIRRLEVPEWGEDDKPLVITYKMVTLDDLALVVELDGTEFDKQAARIVALKSLDEAGNRLFSTIDAVELRKSAAPDVVKRIAVAMLGRLSVEDAAKN